MNKRISFTNKKGAIHRTAPSSLIVYQFYSFTIENVSTFEPETILTKYIPDL
jgi:hypothetical protein